MSTKHHDVIRIKSKAPPVVGFDGSAITWYIRFSNRKVAKTISEDKPGAMVAFDFDEKGNVVGVEMPGIKESSLAVFQKMTGIGSDEVDFSEARFIPSGAELQPAQAGLAAGWRPKHCEGRGWQ